MVIVVYYIEVMVMLVYNTGVMVMVVYYIGMIVMAYYIGMMVTYALIFLIYFRSFTKPYQHTLISYTIMSFLFQ